MSVFGKSFKMSLTPEIDDFNIEILRLQEEANENFKNFMGAILSHIDELKKQRKGMNWRERMMVDEIIDGYAIQMDYWATELGRWSKILEKQNKNGSSLNGNIGTPVMFDTNGDPLIN